MSISWSLKEGTKLLLDRSRGRKLHVDCEKNDVNVEIV